MNSTRDCCRTCGHEFVDKKRKRNITGEFAKKFEVVVSEKLSEDDSLPRAVCDKCKYQIQKVWRQSNSVSLQEPSVQQLLKQKHPVSPLTSTKGDDETVTNIERKKKGHRLVFDSTCSGPSSTGYVNIQPKFLEVASAPVVPCPSGLPSVIVHHPQKIVHTVASQTLKSSCQCRPSTTKGTSVKVIAQFNSKTVTRELPKSLNSLGIALCLKRPSSGISLAAFKNRNLRNALIKRTCLQINKECKRLEKKSVLKKTAVNDLKHFHWNTVLQEWQQEAPTFYKTLKAIAMPPTISRNQKKKQSLKPFIGSAGAILLKGRNTRLCAVQHLVGLSLFLGHTQRKGFSRLQKLGMSVCKPVTNRKIFEMASGYDKKLKAWKAGIEKKKEVLQVETLLPVERVESSTADTPIDNQHVVETLLPIDEQRVESSTADTPIHNQYVDCTDSPHSIDFSSVVSCDSFVSSEASDSEDNDDSGPGRSTPVEYTSEVCDYGLNGDNLDWLRRPSIYSKDKDTESVHWFNLLAYDNRVVDWNLSDKEPVRDIMELPNSSFLPSPDDHAKLKRDFVLLVLRILVKNCKYFSQFVRLIPAHIPHQHSKEMSQQSHIVHLGLVEKNENKIPEMLKILQHCNEEYVPTDTEKTKILHKIHLRDSKALY